MRLPWMMPAALLLLAAAAGAENAKPEAWITDGRAELSALSETVDTLGGSLQAKRQLAEFKGRILPLRSRARTCSGETQARIESLNARRGALGETAQEEAAEVTRARQELDQQLLQAGRERAECEQLSQASQELIERIQGREQAAMTAHLYARGSSTVQIAGRAFSESEAWTRLLAGLLGKGSGWERLSTAQLVTAAVLLLALALAGAGLRRRWLAGRTPGTASRSAVAALPLLLPAAGAATLFFDLLPGWPPALIASAPLALTLWLAAGIALDRWLPGWVAAGLDAQAAAMLRRRLRTLAALVLLGGLLLTADAVIRLPDPHYFLLRSVLAWLLVFSLGWSGLLLGQVPGLAGTQLLRLLMVVAAVTVAVTETAGYRNLSLYLLAGFTGTAAGLAVAVAAAHASTALFDGLDEGRHPWQQFARRWAGVRSREQVPGLIWLRLFADLLIWSAFTLLALFVWGLYIQGTSLILEYATDGFHVGSLHIAPVQLVAAVVVFAIGMALTRWLKLRVITDLVKRTRLDRGGREAMVTISGYMGVTATLLVSLAVAGISFTNLAIIAGALSVGIGFGLQNVVNNFVSGLILLFERPVRTGDWIVVGDTQGYVRKISIRSTQIETFDRADVIVPNSDLISSKVSNWMLRDAWGRISVPVGVAYGSDVRKVIGILVSVANAHEGVLKDQPGVPAPKALFMRFGDSALDFELRCFIRQIDKMFDVKSDLNIAIDEAFREAGITIPFPQRDVHVHTLPDEGRKD